MPFSCFYADISDSCREFQQIFTVLSSEIRHRPYRSLLPQQIIGKRGDIRHVDAAAYYDTAFHACGKRDRHQGADRCENYRRIKLDRRITV
jgi:hypothetical protein